MKIIVLICVVIFLTGCISIPKSSADLVKTASATQLYCYDIEHTVVEKRLKNFLDTCYSAEYSTVTTQYGTFTNKIDEKVEKEIIENGIRYSHSNTAGYAFSVDVFPMVNNCKTQVKLYGVSIFWKKNFDNVDNAIKDNKIDCPI